MVSRRGLGGGVLALCAGLALMGCDAKENGSGGSPADFYKGKTVHVVVGYSAGGGFDTYARLVAKYMAKHIPGDPTMVVDNRDGAASLLAANYVYGQGPEDGTVIGSFNGSLFLHEAIGVDGVTFDSSKLKVLGGPGDDYFACVVRADSGVKSLDDLKTASTPLKFGGTSPGDATSDLPTFMKDELGLAVKPVPGYPGVADVALALRNGDVDGLCNSWQATAVTLKDELADGTLVPIAQTGDEPHPDLADVPLLSSVASNDADVRRLQALSATGDVLRPFVVGPGVPDARTDALRDAFGAAIKDPDFVAAATKANLPVTYISPAQFETGLKTFDALSDSDRVALRSIVQPG